MMGLGTVALVARADGDASALVGPLSRALRAAGPTVPLVDSGTFDDLYDALLRQQRFAAWLLGAFSALALAVAAVGIYGLVAFAVTQRTREVGIRVALGARPAGVMRLVMESSLRHVALGVAVGLGLAALAARATASLLYGVSTTDALTYTGTSLALAAVAVVAAFVPAWRATRIDPVTALRSE